ncbi:MAG: methylmalonyl-CoA epimerase [Acidimicrobiales bacterium]
MNVPKRVNDVPKRVNARVNAQWKTIRPQIARVLSIAPAQADNPSLLTEIDHVAIAVRDVDAAAAWYKEAFGAEVVHREYVERDQVEEVLLAVSDSFIQLLTPMSDSSPVAKFLEQRGEGLHHIGYRVKDCAAALESVKATGAKVIDQVPRPGSRGTTVAFVHPKGAFGTLVELIEE